jgi:glucosamine--fructose-6-phosphate aminotransferase (isomerizing)
VAAAVAAALPRVDALAGELVDREHLFVVGSGNATAAAYETALKLKEMALVHAEGAESWEMASGAATIVGPGSVVVALAPTGPGRDATLDVARHAAEWGARIVEVGPGAGPATEGADHLPLPASAAEDLAPLTAVAPVALLAFVLARRRGHDPDHPGWVERYHSQGLRHIVGVDNAVTEG